MTPNSVSVERDAGNRAETRQDGGHVVYYACKYTPVELLAGFGARSELAEADVSSFDEADRAGAPQPVRLRQGPDRAPAARRCARGGARDLLRRNQARMTFCASRATSTSST